MLEFTQSFKSINARIVFLFLSVLPKISVWMVEVIAPLCMHRNDSAVGHYVLLCLCKKRNRIANLLVALKRSVQTFRSVFLASTKEKVLCG
jgi:hypothetical protein